MTLSTILGGLFGRAPQVGAYPATAGKSLLNGFEIAPDVRRLIRQRQYCKILLKNADLPFDDLSIRVAWEVMQSEMALTPPGTVTLTGLSPAASAHQAEVAPCFIDRYCVSNLDFLQFVEAGGYHDTQYWPESILTDLLKFTDSTGVPGPRFWRDGKPLKDRVDHPVVGICWFEANAYAQWAGKRLPTPAQWQRVGTWGKSTGGSESRYPWGNSFKQGHANTWTSRIGDTVPVNHHPEGGTPSGVCQLIGNTWEWLNGHFSLNPSKNHVDPTSKILAEVRGGAFDTYFASQATCQFRTGQPLMVRPANLGFRCCVESSQVIDLHTKSIQQES